MTNGFVLATDPTQPPRGLEGAVYAIGNFDGMHLGHQAVIERTVALARSRAASFPGSPSRHPDPPTHNAGDRAGTIQPGPLTGPG